MRNKAKAYIISIGIALAVGILSALLTMGSMNLYPELVKPRLAPPAIVFPIVWTILYILMGISSAMVYIGKDKSSRTSNRALVVYGANLFVNFFWSIIFFEQRAFLAAFLWLILLWLIVILMIVKFYRVNRTSAYLQIPYLLWVTFAGYLNLAIYLLNR